MSELRWTYGGNGSHWDGCAEVHWDCKIAQLEAENKKLRHALEVIADSNGHHDHSLTYAQLIEYAKDALDNGELDNEEEK